MSRSITDTSLLHQINITPLLDVFLVLLVALIAMVPLAVDDLVAQAEARVKTVEQPKGPVHVLEVGPTSMTLDGRPLKADSLAGLSGTVRLVAGEQTSYGRVLAVAQRVSALPGVGLRFAASDALPVIVAPVVLLPPPMLPAAR